MIRHQESLPHPTHPGDSVEASGSGGARASIHVISFNPSVAGFMIFQDASRVKKIKINKLKKKNNSNVFAYI